MEQCLTLSTGDLISLCEQLSGRIESLKAQPYWTAVIAAMAAALTAFLSTRGSMLASRRERRNKSQREALYGAQDAAQALRTKWTSLKSWREKGEDGKNPLPEHKEQDLLAALEKMVSRIQDAVLKDALNDWRDFARLYFNGSEEHDRHGERDRWKLAIDLCGKKALEID
ncbi:MULTISPECIES: hypothetical protein [Paenarthrobacter]|uniref:Uncharacterized protein n=1 Tax=Paenarthrobacter ureafaciens TaxID=37931 RepID=A0AAX3EMU4_PAEUR|nr:MULTISPECIES: hypothetical protein [Paenarthrobacter]NKR12495.1 hypothetical protein [Arthrobacter sp. M5]NKR14325.1 hypothetical protein [Arthrobacter sp. M6]OEH61796.1 hypothetical protein A5N13_15560 [Arthrobacter sp. D4]OEH64098.1 hypothetical protein A5N17_06540 [Arthrobacter sp. D2]MDO5863423.1 hypothetical protein [Paenarthrobacter sp. SD-2]